MRGIDDLHLSSISWRMACFLCVHVEAGALAAQAVQWHSARTFPFVQQASMVFDTVRGRLVLFGGKDSAPLDQTWEWDGQVWLQRESGTTPPPRTGHAMAFDASHRRVVLFGGMSATGAVMNDTWEWNGNEWSLRNPMTQPAGRGSHAMAYDAARQRVVCFGGGGMPTNQSETWLWDGVDWSLQAPPTVPPGRAGHAMVYDSARARVVLYGGSPTTNCNNTWEWDGTDWHQVLVVNPPERSLHGMVYDPVRQRTVVHGGGYSVTIFSSTYFQPRADTWEFDGISWTQAVGGTPDGLGYSFAAAFDGNRQRVVALGGAAGGAARAHWEWDGMTWQRAAGLAPTVPSGAPFGNSMAFDDARNCVVYATPTATWEFRATTWYEVSGSPMPRERGAMVYDAWNQRTVLFGGRDLGGVLRGDTMLWDGISWSIANTGVSPGARDLHAMAYDSVRRKVVLFGGAKLVPGNFFPVIDNETWEWDGVGWTQRSPSVSPLARVQASAVYDPLRQVTVLYGGERFGLTGLLDTWEWDGTNWLLRPTSSNPGARWTPAMVYDRVQQCTVLIGQNGDTWHWDGANWSQQVASPLYTLMTAYDSQHDRVVSLSAIGRTMLRGPYVPASVQSGGVACGGMGGLPLAAGPLPYLGNPRFRVEILGAPSLAPCLFGLSVAQVAQPLGFGCTLYLDQVVMIEAAVANSAGHAEAVVLEVPYGAALRGLSLHTQGLALDPTSPLGFALTGWRTLSCGD